MNVQKILEKAHDLIDDAQSVLVNLHESKIPLTQEEHRVRLAALSAAHGVAWDLISLSEYSMSKETDN